MLNHRGYMNFASLLTDRVSVLKPDGTRFDNIAASVQTKKVFINQSTPLIEPGDLIVRSMSNGAVDTMRVIDPGFHEEFHGIPAGYQMTVEKLGLPEAKMAVQSITYNVHGSNARINHQSFDMSTNIVQESTDAERLIAELRKVIDEAVLTINEKSDALDIIESVEIHFSSAKPKKSVVTAMLAALPAVGTIAETIGKLVALVN